MPKFTPATRKKAKLRLGLDGPAGTGKTYTALRLAFTIGKRVAVIDTESGSASKYQGDSPDGVPFDFDVLELDSFAPTDYTAAIEEAGRLGYDVLIIDGLSHAWQGKDGALELVNKKGGNSFTAWKDVTPMHTRMIEAIIRAPLHVIATLRSKTEYVLETNANGKQEPRKIGMAPIQRAGMEYEFDIYGSMDWSHVLTVSKSRCPSVDNAVVVKPGPSFMEPIIRWLETGEVVRTVPAPRVMVEDGQVKRIVAKIGNLGRTLDGEKNKLFKRYSVSDFAGLTTEQATDFEKRLDVDLSAAAKKQQQAAQQAEAKPAETNGKHEQQPAADATIAPANLPTDAAPDAPATRPRHASLDQVRQLRELSGMYFRASGMNDSDAIRAKWSEVLGKRGVTSESGLTPEQADELLGNLRKKSDELFERRGEKCPF